MRLWDVARLAPLGPPMRGHTDWIQSVAFSPDGNTLASAGGESTVRLWDVGEQRSLGPPLVGHTDRVQDVAFSPDGTLLASTGTDRTVHLWPATAWARAPSSEICSRVRRNLTREQCEFHLPGEEYRETCPAV